MKRQLEQEGNALKNSLQKQQIIQVLSSDNKLDDLYIQNIDSPVIGAAIGFLALQGVVFAEAAVFSELGAKEALAKNKQMIQAYFSNSDQNQFHGQRGILWVATVLYAGAGAAAYWAFSQEGDAVKYRNKILNLSEYSLGLEVERVQESIETHSKNIIEIKSRLEKLK